jgi:tetratricopeptide (TPR) repeat protein
MTTLYYNDLAPWELKKEYYEDIELGRDVDDQARSISHQTKALIQAQLAAAGGVVASQNRIAEGIDVVACEVNRVAQGMFGLKAAFEWGISEVVWQIEQNRDELRSIVEILSAPLDTQSKELRKRAEEAYANGWIDDALDDFHAALTKNRYDFSIHLSLGVIYLFRLADKEKALEFFESAIKYAKPKSPYHTSYALLHKALILRDFGRLEEAEECTRQAAALCPQFAEAIYQNAQYNALLQRADKAVAMLLGAIKLDLNYCEKSLNDESFDGIRHEVVAALDGLREMERLAATSALNDVRESASRVLSIADAVNGHSGLSADSTAVRSALARVEELVSRDSLRDYREAITLLRQIPGQENDLILNALRTVDGRISRLAATARESRSAQIITANTEDLWRIWVVAVPLGIVLGLGGCWVRGPGSNGSVFEALSALVRTPLVVWLLAGIAHLIAYLVIKGEGNSSRRDSVDELRALRQLSDAIRRERVERANMMNEKAKKGSG